jgi:hypothetical protein
VWLYRIWQLPEGGHPTTQPSGSGGSSAAPASSGAPPSSSLSSVSPAPSASATAVPPPTTSASGNPAGPAASAGGWVADGDLIASDTKGYNRYVNARFGFSVDVPAGFTEDQPPANGDGRSFTSRSGVDKVAVWGQYNVQDETPKSAFDDALSGSATQSVTYSALTGDVMVVSGINGDGNIYYWWETVGPGVIFVMDWEYPPSDKPTVGPLLEQAVKTFHPGLLTMP